jgi:hypothetical protein
MHDHLLAQRAALAACDTGEASRKHIKAVKAKKI